MAREKAWTRFENVARYLLSSICYYSIVLYSSIVGRLQSPQARHAMACGNWHVTMPKQLDAIDFAGLGLTLGDWTGVECVLKSTQTATNVHFPDFMETRKGKQKTNSKKEKRNKTQRRAGVCFGGPASRILCRHEQTFR